jgi:hypothetical protein
MNLADFEPVTLSVKIKGSSFLVRGLSLADLTPLIATYYPDLKVLVESWSGSRIDAIGDAQLQQFILDLCARAPALATDIIAAGADITEEKGRIAIRRMPFPVQVEALKSIFHLTFEDIGGAGNFAATLVSLTGGMFPGAAAAIEKSLEGMQAALMNSSPVSGVT